MIFVVVVVDLFLFFFFFLFFWGGGRKTITASLPDINRGGSTAVHIPRRRGVELVRH